MNASFHLYKDNVFIEKREISIFKTSVKDKNDVLKTEGLLNFIVGQSNWNFDLEDSDNILRINAYGAANGFLVQELRKLGFRCTELF